MPDAPPPVYARSGRIVDAWSLSITYDSVRDVLVVHGVRSGGAHHDAEKVTRSYPALDLQRALEAFEAAARRFGARRLF